MNLFLEAGTIFWILGGLVGIFGTAFLWLGRRVEGKLSKDVFEQFEKRNEDQHEANRIILNDIKETVKSIKEDDKEAHDRIFNKLDNKQDK